MLQAWQSCRIPYASVILYGLFSCSTAAAEGRVCLDFGGSPAAVAVFPIVLLLRTVCCLLYPVVR